MKKFNFKKAVTATLLISMMAPAVVSAAGQLPPSAASQGVSIVVNGERQTPPADMGSPYIDMNSSRTMVPVRFVSEKLGLNVNYVMRSNEAPLGGIIVGDKNGTVITMNTNSTTAIKTTKDERKTLVMDAPSIIYDGRTYVPVRFISEALGYDVDWKDSTVYINEVKKYVPVGFEKSDRLYVDGYDLYWEKSGDKMILRDYSRNKLASEDVNTWKRHWDKSSNDKYFNVYVVTFDGTDREFEDRYDLSRNYFRYYGGFERDDYNRYYWNRYDNDSIYNPNKGNGGKLVGNDPSKSEKPEKNINTTLPEGVFGDSSTFISNLNSYRQSKGLNAVKEDSELNRLAALRAEEEVNQLIQTGDGDHFSEGGYNLNLGENLSTFRYSTVSTASPLDTQVLGRWKNSSGHNSNLLWPDAVRSGFACYRRVINDRIYETSIYLFSTDSGEPSTDPFGRPGM